MSAFSDNAPSDMPPENRPRDEYSYVRISRL